MRDHDHFAGSEEQRAEAGAEEPVPEEPPGAPGDAQQPPQAPPRALTPQVSLYPAGEPAADSPVPIPLPPEQKWLKLDKHANIKKKHPTEATLASASRQPQQQVGNSWRRRVFGSHLPQSYPAASAVCPRGRLGHVHGQARAPLASPDLPVSPSAGPLTSPQTRADKKISFFPVVLICVFFLALYGSQK